MITVILNFPTKNIVTYLLFSVFQKHLPENYSSSVLFWKNFVLGLKVVYGELLKSNLIIFSSILRKRTLAKNVLTLLKRITDTFKCLALPKKLLTDFFQCCRQKSFCSRCSSVSKNSENSNQKIQEHHLVYFNRL